MGIQHLFFNSLILKGAESRMSLRNSAMMSEIRAFLLKRFRGYYYTLLVGQTDGPIETQESNQKKMIPPKDMPFIRAVLPR